MNEPEKLTIRINFRKKKDGAPGEPSRGDYLWGRIIGVSLVVIVALASLISAGVYYLNQVKADNEQVESPVNKVADKQINSPDLMPPSSLNTDIVPDEKTAIKSAIEDTTPEETVVIKSAVADTVTEEAAGIKSAVADTVTEETAAIKPAVADTVTEETAVIKPAVADTVTEEAAAIKSAVADTVTEETAVIESAVADTVAEEAAAIKSAVADTVTEETAAIKSAVADTVSQAIFTQSQTDLLSANVTRFVISQAVQDNEPIGTINDIHFDDNNIATVYAYSDVTELKDQTLYYQWSLDGKKIAKIRVDVRGDRWRSYSSKFIQPHMHGEWKVELQNQAGENLAIHQFVY